MMEISDFLKKQHKSSSGQFPTRDLIIGASGSTISTVLVYIYGIVTEAGNLITITLGAATLCLLLTTFFFALKLRASLSQCKQLAAPGYRGWIIDRKSDRFAESIIDQAKFSIEVMGATGSSVFHQGGRILNLLFNKYETNTSFRLRVLLVDPDAKNLIEYRKQRLGNEPNVLSPDDIRSTIAVLNKAKKDIKRGPDQSLDIRTYSSELVWSIFLIDREIAFLGAYGPAASGWKWPVLIFEKNDPLSFYYAVEEQFDQRWQAAREN